MASSAGALEAPPGCAQTCTDTVVAGGAALALDSRKRTVITEPVTDADGVAAHRANALFDAHRDDPEFGYRYVLEEAGDAGQVMAERTAWAICSQHGW